MKILLDKDLCQIEKKLPETFGVIQRDLNLSQGHGCDAKKKKKIATKEKWEDEI